MQVLFCRKAKITFSRWFLGSIQHTYIFENKTVFRFVQHVAELRIKAWKERQRENARARPKELKLLITTQFTKLIDGKVNRDIWVEKSANWFNDKIPSAVDPKEEELIAATKRFRDLKLIYFQYSNMIADVADKNRCVLTRNSGKFRRHETRALRFSVR